MSKGGRCCGGGIMRVMCAVMFTAVLVILLLEVLNLGVIYYSGAAIQFGSTNLESLSALYNPALFGGLQIKATKLRGRAATEYKRRVQCFSESGKWVYNDTPRWIPANFVGDTLMASCDARWLNSTAGGLIGEEANRAAANGSHWNVRKDLRWQWQTGSEFNCPLVPFDRDGFCRLVGAKGNMLIVGDSLNQQIFFSFLTYLLKNTTGMKFPLSNWRAYHLKYRVCEDVVGGDGFDIGYIRNDRLSLTQKWEKCMRNSSGFQEYPWIHYLEEWDISILVLNRGAHYETNGNYTEHLINTLHLIQARYPSTMVFYRSTPHGHPNCSQYDGPITAPVPPETMRYSWKHFAEQNELARQIIEEFEHTFIDLAAALNKRPDGHQGTTDCLHYCLPGPMDVFLPLFYNTLLLALQN